jgi:hypothetical protein
MKKKMFILEFEARMKYAKKAEGGDNAKK